MLTNKVPEQPDWVRLGYPTNALLWALAGAVDRIRRVRPADTHVTEDRGVSSRGRFIEYIGSRQFAYEFKLVWQPRVLAHGTHRQNFTLPDGRTVDVLTRRPQQGMRWPDLLLRQDSRATADLLSSPSTATGKRPSWWGG